MKDPTAVQVMCTFRWDRTAKAWRLVDSVLDDTDSRHGPVGTAYDCELKPGTLILVWDFQGGVRVHRYAPVKAEPTAGFMEDGLRKIPSSDWWRLIAGGAQAIHGATEEAARLLRDYYRKEG